ncbi:MAG: response regulator transcription factor [Clostridia bacterium]|nr:response regulator transcription factor [Clostridia bacterium]
MGKRKVLIVDDEPDIREILELLLKSNNYEVFSFADGESAINILKNNTDIDLVILDVMMPYEDGITVMKKIREFSNIPALFLTAKTQESDKAEAYASGGDDYLAKPFSQNELLMKVNSLIRRYRDYSGVDDEKNKEDAIVIDEKNKKVYKLGVELNLTDTEYDMLKFFMENRGKPVDTKTLYEKVWGEKYIASAANTIMVHILNLRKKIEDDHTAPMYLKTIWGKGYQFD